MDGEGESGHEFPVFDSSRPKESSSQPPDQKSSESHKPRVLPQRYHLRKSSVAMYSTARYTPSSPLSPKIPAASLALPLQQKTSRRPSHDLQSLPLPRYHPAVYQSPNQLPAQRQSPTRARPQSRSSARPAHNRQVSDVQRQMRQYQHDLINNAKHMTHIIVPSTPDGNPSSPRLQPTGSPGPVTPLMLEQEGDYFLAGFRRNGDKGSPPIAGEGNSKALVEKLIETESARRNRPESIPRTESLPVSPVHGNI